MKPSIHVSGLAPSRPLPAVASRDDRCPAQRLRPWCQHLSKSCERSGIRRWDGWQANRAGATHRRLVGQERPRLAAQAAQESFLCDQCYRHAAWQHGVWQAAVKCYVHQDGIAVLLQRRNRDPAERARLACAVRRRLHVEHSEARETPRSLAAIWKLAIWLSCYRDPKGWLGGWLMPRLLCLCKASSAPQPGLSPSHESCFPAA